MDRPAWSTYKGPATADDAFVVAWKAPGSCFYTNAKSAAYDAPFGHTFEWAHCYPFDRGEPFGHDCVQIGPPAAAADSVRHIAEALVVGNDYFTFPQ